MAICWLLAYLGEQWKVLIKENACHLMSVLITISHPLSKLASSIVLAQVRSEF